MEESKEYFNKCIEEITEDNKSRRSSRQNFKKFHHKSKEDLNITKSHMLYCRLPYKVQNEKEVFSLHSDILQVKFLRRRHKECTLLFKNEKKARNALEELQGKVVKNGKRLFVNTFSSGKRAKMVNPLKFHISELPDGVNKSHIKLCFPTCVEIEIAQNRKNVWNAKVLFGSKTDACNALPHSGTCTINGVECPVNYAFLSHEEMDTMRNQSMCY